MSADPDVGVLRRLALKYAEAAAKPVQEQRRSLWRAHMSLKPTPPPVLLTYGMWNLWCRETFGDSQLECRDPFYREHERSLRLLLFHDTLGDDYILEPWINLRAALLTPPGGMWGLPFTRSGEENTDSGGSWKYDPPLKDWSDLEKLAVPFHRVDEAETARRLCMRDDDVYLAGSTASSVDFGGGWLDPAPPSDIFLAHLALRRPPQLTIANFAARARGTGAWVCASSPTCAAPRPTAASTGSAPASRRAGF